MKYLLSFIFLISYCYAIDKRVDFSAGVGEVEGTNVSVQSSSFYFLKQVYKTQEITLKLGTGLRWNRITASEFAIYKNQEIIEDLNLNSYNIALYSEANYDNWAAGFNIDLIGSTEGDKSSINSSEEKPTSFNMFRGGSNDEGTLNSEFWIGRKLNQLMLRVGLSHAVIQFEGDNPENEKRQRFFDSFFASLNWTF